MLCKIFTSKRDDIIGGRLHRRPDRRPRSSEISKRRPERGILQGQRPRRTGKPPVIEEFTYFHDFTNIILLFILTIIVGAIMFRISTNKITHNSLLEGQILEH